MNTYLRPSLFATAEFAKELAIEELKKRISEYASNLLLLEDAVRKVKQLVDEVVPWTQ